MIDGVTTPWFDYSISIPKMNEGMWTDQAMGAYVDYLMLSIDPQELNYAYVGPTFW